MNVVDHINKSITQWRSDKRNTSRVYLTETLPMGDKRGSDSKFAAAKKKEVAGLKENRVFEVVFPEDVPANANILGGRFALTIKNKGTEKEMYKARYIVQGHRDREKYRLVHTSTNLGQSSIRLLTALAAIFGFRIWSQDVTQAYLQSADKLMMDIYIKPNKELRMEEGQLLKLMKPLYGLGESGDYSDVTMTRHLKKDLGMTPSAIDLSLFFKKVDGRLHGMTGMYVDDGIHVGDGKFLQECNKKQEKFKSSEREMDRFKFAGIEVRKTDEGILLHQTEHASRIKPLPKDCQFREYRSLRQRLHWFTHTRPDICCVVNKATQVTDKTFGNKAIHDLNKVVNHVHKRESRGLLQKQLDEQSMNIRVYADSSLADNEDLTTQLGFIVLLCDKHDRCNVLHFRSHKSRRVVRSVLGGETYAFADGMDFALALKSDIKEMTGRAFKARLFTDSKSLFDVITKNTSTTEKRLMIDIRSMREAYERLEISDVRWIKSASNPADEVLTKVKDNIVLNAILEEGVVRHPTEQWVIRKNPFNDDSK